MSGPVEFLTGFAQALAALSLYPEGHTSRERAVDALHQRVQDLLAADPRPQFSFLGDEVVYGNLPLKDLRQWDWSRRLSDLGVQRLQFDQTVTRDDLENFLDEVLARLTLKAVDTSEARQMRPSGIRYGAVGITGDEGRGGEVATATIAFTLNEEAEAIRWIHQELQEHRDLPLIEAEAVVRSLSVAMHGEQQIMLPLLTLREFDEYTTTHSMNVSVLAMGLAEWMGLAGDDVRAFGVAGLLHDLGKVKIPMEILNKTGKLDAREREIMNAHPVEGARLILASEEQLELAAVVAYEHHIMLNGGGYPSLRYQRECHRASRLVHVCDVFDALRTDRPYRSAWPLDKVLAYIEERSGTEFDGMVAHAFAGMMREWEPKVAVVAEDQALPAV
ncbi:MAG TPA: HD domain-containing phosphohydrolase [Gemmatimonadales bacterium]|nr:HD domain-containing phosphohydrolase [Gemmatimonadales bacterium]